MSTPLLLLVCVALASAAPVPPPACVAGGSDYRWMGHEYSANGGNLRLNQILVPGSHDAGCLTGATTGWFRDNAITQSRDITGQLCAGVRFFDLRFRHDGTNGGDYKIHHGFTGFRYYFHTLTAIANEIAAFIHHQSTSREVIILRVKVENDGINHKQAVYQSLLGVLNSHGRQCTVERRNHLADAVFSDKTLTNIWTTVALSGLGAPTDCSKVFIVDYENEANNNQLTTAVRQNIWNYQGNILGKATQHNSFESIMKAQMGKLGRGPTANEMTAIWTNTYGGSPNSHFNKMRDNGRRGHWPTWLLTEIPNNIRFNILVTDFGGEVADVLGVCRAVAANLVANPVRNRNHGIVSTMAAAPTFGWAQRKNPAPAWNSDAAFLEDASEAYPASVAARVRAMLTSNRVHRARFARTAKPPTNTSTSTTSKPSGPLKGFATKCLLCGTVSPVLVHPKCCKECATNHEMAKWKIENFAAEAKKQKCCFPMEPDQLKTLLKKPKLSEKDAAGAGSC